MASQNTKKRKADFLAHYTNPANACSITNACKAAAINRSTYSEWKSKDLAFNKACLEAEEQVKDWGESQLYKQMQNGNTAATIFFLCNKAKDRGWRHVQNIEYSGDAPKLGVLVEVIEAGSVKVVAGDNQKQIEGSKL